MNRILSSKSSKGESKLILTIHSHYPCDRIEDELNELTRQSMKGKHNYPMEKLVHGPQQPLIIREKPDFKKKYIIHVKTGNKMLSGTDANVFIRMYDTKNRQSEDIALTQTVTNKKPFGKNSIDEFHTGTRNNLSDLEKVHLWHIGGVHDGWHIQWLQIFDIEARRLYCFPIVSKTIKCSM